VTRIAIDARKIEDFGIGAYLRGLVGELVRLGGEFEWVLLGDPASAARIPEAGTRVEWRPLRSRGYSIGELFALAPAVRAARADLLHIPHYVVPCSIPCPVVTTVHDLIHLRFPEFRSRLERFYAGRMVPRALDRAAATIAVSETTAQELRERYPTRSDRLVTVPNGVDERYFETADPERDRATLAARGLTRGYLLFVGNPKPHKNLPRLLEAYRQVRARLGDDAPSLVLAGGAAETGEAGVRTIGRVTEVELPALYRGASIVVVPSLWEGFGLPAAEAMACGVAVAASNRGALPEVTGEAAEPFDPRRPEEIAGSILRLLGNPDRRRDLARRGRERARRFSWSNAARATLEVYRSVLGTRSIRR